MKTPESARHQRRAAVFLAVGAAFLALAIYGSLTGASAGILAAIPAIACEWVAVREVGAAKEEGITD